MLRRGEIHLGSVLADEAKGHEQHNELGSPRPWLIVSDGRLERSGLVVACPITSTTRIPPALELFRLPLDPSMVVSAPGDVGTDRAGTILVDQLRAMAVERFQAFQGGITRVGRLTPNALASVEEKLHRVLGL